MKLLEEFRALWSDAESIWTEHQNEEAFDGYVSADYPAIYESLLKLRSQAVTFLEWGSGLGVVTIMAARLGFDAYGIEVKPELVDYSQELASRYASKPCFAVGSFVPDGYQNSLHEGAEYHRTETDDCSAYNALDMELRDFDLVYAYPWPEEHELFESVLREAASPSTWYLRYDAREGLALSRPASHD